MTLRLNVNNKGKIAATTKSMRQQINRIPDEAYRVFKDETPKKSGNARNKTKLKNKKIEANYPYAQRLDEGYSKQSPDGMIKPTVEFITQRFKDIMSGK